MITFKDGPAAGQALALRRAPIYLRVVQDETTDVFDALDQVDDTPGPSERIYVYRRVSYGGPVHICYRGKDRRSSGWYEIAEYAAVDIDGERFRDTRQWREWCLGQPEARPPAAAFGA